MTISEKSFVGVDGFIELAKGRGLLQVTTVVGPGASGNECVVRLVESEKATEYRYTMEDVEKQGCGHTHAWDAHPYEMLKSFGIRNAIMDHYELSKCGFDRDETLLMQTYPDARVWEHAPQDWQIAAGNSGEIKTYGHKTREDAITCVANRIRAMKESKGINFAEPSMKCGRNADGYHDWKPNTPLRLNSVCVTCGVKADDVMSGLEPATEGGFEDWWDEEIGLAQIHIGTGDYWVSKGIAEKAWNAARRGHRE